MRKLKNEIRDFRKAEIVAWKSNCTTIETDGIRKISWHKIRNEKYFNMFFNL